MVDHLVARRARCAARRSAADAVAITCAPRSCASWVGEVADAAGRAVDQDALPGLQPPWTNSPCHALSAASGTRRPRRGSSVRGFGASSSPERPRTRPRRRRGRTAVSAKTASPTPTLCDAGPTPATTPDISYDGIAGRRSTGHSSSSRVIAAAWTRTSASPAPGSRRRDLLHDEPVQAVSRQQPDRAHCGGKAPRLVGHSGSLSSGRPGLSRTVTSVLAGNGYAGISAAATSSSTEGTSSSATTSWICGAARAARSA